MDKLPLEIQTLYAELLEQATALEAHRTIGHLPGCFTIKEIKGESYYYFQHGAPGGILKQIYIGKATPAMDRVVARFKEDRDAFRADQRSTQRLCTLLRVGGAMATDGAAAKVVQALATGGVFHSGGVLVGTQAFIVLGNLLGVHWTKSALRTQDIDIAGSRSIGVVFPEIHADIPSALQSLQMGFLPVPPFNRASPTTSFKVRGQALRVDLLTPASRRESPEPVHIPRFNAAAQPLRFLGFLITKPVQGVALGGAGILVSVPAPARFAVHKLVVSGERAVAETSKIDKDLLQASQLFQVLMDERPGDLGVLRDDLGTEPGLMKRIQGGLQRMSKTDASLSKAVRRALRMGIS